MLLIVLWVFLVRPTVNHVCVSELVQFQRSAVCLDNVYAVLRLQARAVTAVVRAITPSRTATCADVMGLGCMIFHVNRRVSVAVDPTTSAYSVSNAPWDTTHTRHAPHAIVREKALLMGHVTQSQVSACVILP